MLTDFQRRISWCHFPEIRVFSNKEKAVIKMIFLIQDGMLTKFVRSIQQKVGIEFLKFHEDNSMDIRAGSGRQRTITSKENENLIENFICSQ